MKLVLLACLVAVTAAAPHPDRDAQTVVDERQDDGDGNFYYRFEASNSITEERQGTPGVEGQSNMQGSYFFTHPDGTVTVVNFIADENGYRVVDSPRPTNQPSRPRPEQLAAFAGPIIFR
ncbi:cuticle protein AMP1A-like isoform X2 [Homarus americanus]|uniref:cuticle protein AMP1A-like isoform X2 n=1 Tax=Homarus americanus TaxID=6706 RepID=UPI001C4611B5|nr:cuticle protein AMP1A-like isoform X2 [Homarus americanus]